MTSAGDAERSKAQLLDENSWLKKQIDQLIAQKQDVKNQADVLDKRIETFERSVVMGDPSKAPLLEKIHDLEGKLRSLQSEELSTERSSRENDHYERRNGELEAEIGMLRGQLHQLGDNDAKVQAVEKQNQDLATALTAERLKASTLEEEVQRMKTLQDTMDQNKTTSEKDAALIKSLREELEDCKIQCMKQEEASELEREQLQQGATQSAEASAEAQMLLVNMLAQLEKLQDECKQHGAEAEEAPLLRQSLVEQSTDNILLKSQLELSAGGATYKQLQEEVAKQEQIAAREAARATSNEHRITWLEERLQKEVDRNSLLERSQKGESIAASDRSQDRTLTDAAAKQESAMKLLQQQLSSAQQRTTALEEQLRIANSKAEGSFQRAAQSEDQLRKVTEELRAAKSNGLAQSSGRLSPLKSSRIPGQEGTPLQSFDFAEGLKAVHLHSKELLERASLMQDLVMRKHASNSGVEKVLDAEYAPLKQDLQEVNRKLKELTATAVELERGYAQSQGSYMQLQADHVRLQAECEHYKRELANQKSQFELERVAFWEELSAIRKHPAPTKQVVSRPDVRQDSILRPIGGNMSSVAMGSYSPHTNGYVSTAGSVRTTYGVGNEFLDASPRAGPSRHLRDMSPRPGNRYRSPSSGPSVVSPDRLVQSPSAIRVLSGHAISTAPARTQSPKRTVSPSVVQGYSLLSSKSFDGTPRSISRTLVPAGVNPS